MDRDDRILAFVQGKLPQADADAFQSEMNSDAGLAAEVAVLASARSVLGSNQDDMADQSWETLSAKIDEARFRPANLSRAPRLSLLQVAAAIVAAVAIWQFTAAPLFQTGGLDYAPASVAAEGPTLQVRFEANAQIGAISDTIYDLDGRILDGPSAIGLFVIEFPDDASRTAALESLRSSELVNEVFVP